MSCTIRLPDDGVIGINAATSPVDRDGLLDELRQNVDEDLEPLDAEAPGLDPDHVLGIDRGDESPFAAWVDGGFQIGITIPAGVATPEATLGALPTVVSAVATALG
jgi:hypothetical protein